MTTIRAGMLQPYFFTKKQAFEGKIYSRERPFGA
jgi:hypothetical protein